MSSCPFICDCTVHSQDEDICVDCRQVDLDSWLHEKKYFETPKIIFDLPHIANPKCSSCKVLRNSILDDELESRKISDFRLVLHRTRLVFGRESFTESPVFLIKDRGWDRTYHWFFPVSMRAGFSARHSTSNKVNYSLIKEWMDFCDKTHRHCKNDAQISKPSILNVIDCYEKLVIPVSEAVDHYVTLSYVWGHSSNCSFDERPRTVNGAIDIVCKLGFRYLWVDRYCIPQNDESTKQQQIYAMDKIYGESSLTIIAAAGLSPEHGIPGTGSTPRAPSPSIRVGHHCLIGIRPPDVDIGASVWAKRGWTYQEALLSNRRLVFTDKQVYFQCQAMQCTDAMNIPLKEFHSRNFNEFFDNIDIGRVFPRPRELHDRHTVAKRINEFLNRDLSVDKDVLDAIAGILAKYKTVKHLLGFVCGLPICLPMLSEAYEYRWHLPYTRLLCLALLWANNHTMERRSCFPSWTWAGWKRKARRKGEKGRENTIKEYYHTPVYDVGNGEVDIRFQFHYADGTEMDWQKFHLNILALSRFGRHPSRLQVQGWTFGAEARYEKSWLFTSPPSIVGKKSLCKLGRPTDGRHIRSFLILVIKFSSYGPPSGPCTVLVLTTSNDGSSFERVTAQTILSKGAFVVHQPEETAQIGELQLQWRDIMID